MKNSCRLASLETFKCEEVSDSRWQKLGVKVLLAFPGKNANENS